MERAKVPTTVHTLDAAELAQTGQSEIGAALTRRTPGVNNVDVAGNPFQPQIEYRGFSASPIQGTPQGLAVYQNGVRINEAWGDTVNWDLIPAVAIERLSLFSANPAFGLNALGGAVSVDMKNGFNWQGFEVDMRGGSNFRRQGSVQYGVKSGDFAAYLALEGVGDKGSRHFSDANVRRGYADLGYRAGIAELHATVGFGANRFTSTGPAPADMIVVDPRAIYTFPQRIQNSMTQFALTAAFDFSPTWKVKAHLYHRAFDQARTDGNTTDFQSCGAAVLCDNNGLATSIPDVMPGAPYGVVDRTWVRSRTFGGGVQATNTDQIFGHSNHMTFGASYDSGTTNFKAAETLGVILPNLFTQDLGPLVNEPANDVVPVSLKATNKYLGLYALDTFDVTDRLSVTLGGRYNLAKIALYDQLGASLNGGGTFGRFNPTAGATFKLTPDVSLFANYSEANRAPTPLELGCADPNRPCGIDNFVVSDPPLKQVVSRTVEAGARGHFTLASVAPGKFDWSLGIYRTINSNDIMSVPSVVTGRGYFVNAGRTQRQGVEASLNYRDERLSAYLNYTFTDARFRDYVTLGSPNNPLAMAIGSASIMVTPGAHLASVSPHRIKAGADYALTPQWKVGGDVVFATGGYLRGDEINAFGRTPSYTLVNLRTSYQVTKQFQIYGMVENATNVKARTFGAFFSPTQIAFMPFNDPRQYSLAPPLSAYLGMKYTF
ncbi:MAG: TonB-dependent receptor [Hyphomicrobiales bacterium]|nr:TonB-dependent receptor [Hyphomicrobiales bacterium]